MKKQATWYQLHKINRSLTTVKDPKIRNRLLMVKTYYQTGSLRKTADQCGISHGTVKHWHDRYQAGGVRSLTSIKQTGRPTAVPLQKLRAMKQHVLRESKHQGWSVKQMREYIYEESGKRYTYVHTQRIAASWGLSMITPRPQYAHQASQAEQAAFLKGEHG